MLTFDKDYFLGETREDFYIEPMMKSVWATQMEVLQVIEQICSRHNLKYFAAYGTLLGAVRHKGFIPWDDDIDICMIRNDYNKFLQVAPPELPSGFQLYSPYTNDNWGETFALLKNAADADYSPEHLLAFHGCPYAVGVDIFPLDALPDDPSEESVICMLYSALFLASRQVATKLSLVLESLPELEQICKIKFDISHNLKNQLLRAADKVCQLYDYAECSRAVHYFSHTCNPKPFQKKWFTETTRLPFENITISAPKDYEAVLTLQYGDYMTPVKGLQAHSYPIYENQRRKWLSEICSPSQ